MVESVIYYRSIEGDKWGFSFDICQYPLLANIVTLYPLSLTDIELNKYGFIWIIQETNLIHPTNDLFELQIFDLE